MPTIPLTTPVRDADGTLYRPGKAVEVPAELAERLGFTVVDAPAEPATGAEGKLPAVSELAEHIAQMSAEEVQALMATDERKTAQAVYEARLAELAAA